MRLWHLPVISQLALLLCLWGLPPAACATPSEAVQPSPPPAAPPPTPEYLMESAPTVEKIAPGLFRMGEIVINKKERSVSFPAQVNQQEGLVEYLVVHQRGKVHESLLKTSVEPYYLNLAFLLLGFESTDRPLQYQGDPATPQGEPVSITVSYQAGERTLSFAAERWLVRQKNPESPSSEEVSGLNWVYTGARVWNGRFASQTGGCMIAVYHDPDAMVDNGSPGADSDLIWFVNARTALPVATPVTVTVKSLK